MGGGVVLSGRPHNYLPSTVFFFVCDSNLATEPPLVELVVVPCSFQKPQPPCHVWTAALPVFPVFPVSTVAKCLESERDRGRRLSQRHHQDVMRKSLRSKYECSHFWHLSLPSIFLCSIVQLSGIYLLTDRRGGIFNVRRLHTAGILPLSIPSFC